jgi:protocatechuate 3,4-dioxygenase, alpha subunit
MIVLRQTPSQTIGPFFHFALGPTGGAVREEAHGQRIEVFGRVLDGRGAGVSDALIEIWRAGNGGGFLRVATDEEGRFSFRTLEPHAIPKPSGPAQAPHLAVGVFARGLLKRLVTRIYFDGEKENARDSILSLVPESRRPTLVAKRASGASRFRFDIVLQGSGETVFFDS